MNKNPITAIPAMPSNADTPSTASMIEPIARRDFLTLAWKSLLALSGLLGFKGLWQYLSFQPDPAPITHFDLGLVEDLPPDKRMRIPAASAVLVRSGESFRAYSLVCSHLGCLVNLAEDGFACPCHGSRYDQSGQVIYGPAQSSLRVLKVEKNDQGHLILDTSGS